MRDIYQLLQGVITSPKISKESASRLEEIRCHHGYAELGYSDPESGLILTGNWNNADVRNPHYQEGKNDVSQPYWIKADDYVHRVAKVLEERYGAELEWSDEWSECSDCNKLVRNQADSYCWQPSYFDLDGERICHECIENHAEEVFESIEGDPRKALTRDLGLKPDRHGYVKILDKLENGLHEHMASDPKVIAKELKKLGVEKFVFMIDDTSQFYITFSCWVHEDELEKVGVDPDIKTDADVSPAELCKRALQQASAQSRAANDESLLSEVPVMFKGRRKPNVGWSPEYVAEASLKRCEAEEERWVSAGYRITKREFDVPSKRLRLYGVLDGVAYSSIQGDGTAKTAVLKHADIRRCPNLILLPSHYNEDGSCKCEK